jgi:putative transposase
MLKQVYINDLVIRNSAILRDFYHEAIMDWNNRKALGWRLSKNMESSFRIDALRDAIKEYGKPEIFNPDQGSQFTSDEFTSVLNTAAIKIGLDGKGRWMDNIFIERLWRSPESEKVYLKAYESVPEARASINT